MIVEENLRQGSKSKMINYDICTGDLLDRTEIRLSISDIDRMRDLRILMKAIKRRLAEMKKNYVINKEEMLHEKIVLEAIEREIHKRERMILYAGFGIQ